MGFGAKARAGARTGARARARVRAIAWPPSASVGCARGALLSPAARCATPQPASPGTTAARPWPAPAASRLAPRSPHTTCATPRLSRGRTSGRWSGAPCAPYHGGCPPCLPTGQSRATPVAAAIGSGCVGARARRRASGVHLHATSESCTTLLSLATAPPPLAASPRPRVYPVRGTATRRGRPTAGAACVALGSGSG